MQHSLVTLFMASCALYLSVTFERVIGIPGITLAITTSVLASSSRVIKMIVFPLAVFLVATFFAVSLPFVALCITAIQLVLYFFKPYVKQLSTALFYVSAVFSVMIAIRSGIHWNTQTVVTSCIQLVVSWYLIKAFIFREQQTKIQWKKELFSGEVTEKTI